ncbi:TPA: hypothetical protein DDW69_02950 [candidate division CPR2 bacterium]|uniref:DgkA protein n=1 Tax=candidate division CPR2 bacterium GW2011_GWC1_41_48 TaxID=1618344 RepID=A0A0G0Z812_UNCC2|nr:MAG: DgkA protein [candidate division CPR2 bacterium GW2011_GWC2_39_35]KKR27643.1 MAG: DgkA protein [candidate division CPR2 bacterium GW2011_GWD1_39_7]KKR29203.1 MAG: DgkA protein [candidate division CPR2 bacterium GW2011_GWD2_39_7]KKS09153.1 MAG: DgkA protein [candidate division CPR2 bacterium GW2011_GWC1_41_48]OGB59460.1 MAG: hypothetical protein A2Y27_01155 [candidate division CPR2 bacterium GWD1_39_7]OGB70759.1 MAG: hypothetical protein A2Y26_02675 [candidate division CPR2 bacterium GW
MKSTGLSTKINEKRKKQPLHRSFQSAFRGIKHGTEERNFLIHLFFGFLAISLSFVFNLDLIEKTIIVVLTALVLGVELINSAIERSLDFITTEHHPEIAKIKELMAAVVLVFVVAAFVVGVLIFSKAIFLK